MCIRPLISVGALRARWLRRAPVAAASVANGVQGGASASVSAQSRLLSFSVSDRAGHKAFHFGLVLNSVVAELSMAREQLS